MGEDLERIVDIMSFERVVFTVLEDVNELRFGGGGGREGSTL